MKEVDRQVERLSQPLDAHIDPEVAWIDIGSQLEALRKIYRLRTADFTEAMIDDLKRISRLSDDIRDLAFLVVDAREVAADRRADAAPAERRR